MSPFQDYINPSLLTEQELNRIKFFSIKFGTLFITSILTTLS